MGRTARPIDREAAIQGARWKSLHVGYFNNAGIARPVVDAIAGAMSACRPDVLADLGGGTGFLLRQVAGRRVAEGIRLVNVDLSPRQLAQDHSRRIEDLNLSAIRVTRRDLKVVRGRLMLVMRSLLHYFGRDGLRPFLRHLRSQARLGEMFMHQTACFEDARDAGCANRLYSMMRTGKWYPTTRQLMRALRQMGWRLADVWSAPPLALESGALAERYQLTAEDIVSIRTELATTFGPVPAVFAPRGDGFIAWLHYQIFICRAE